jgi:hypothetical protein
LTVHKLGSGISAARTRNAAHNERRKLPRTSHSADAQYAPIKLREPPYYVHASVHIQGAEEGRKSRVQNCCHPRRPCKGSRRADPHNALSAWKARMAAGLAPLRAPRTSTCDGVYLRSHRRPHCPLEASPQVPFHHLSRCRLNTGPQNKVLDSLSRLSDTELGRLRNLGTIPDKYDVAITTNWCSLNNMVADTYSKAKPASNTSTCEFPCA